MSSKDFINEAINGALTVFEGPARAIEEPKISKLYKSVMQAVSSVEKVPRLAWESNPVNINQNPIYIPKRRLLPDSVIKKLALTDDLTGTIILTRQHQIRPFGAPRKNRHSTGFVLEKTERFAREIGKLPDEQAQAILDDIDRRIEQIENRLKTCGSIDDAQDYLGFPEYISMLSRQAVTHGRVATEIVYKTTFEGRKFSYFRPIDVGTIYKAKPYDTGPDTAAQSIRESAIKEIERIKNTSIDPDKLINNQYAWIQLLDDGTPKQAFTAEECVCHNFYPTLDVELEGYPVTPIDIAINSIVSHISLTVYNRLYFEAGRSAKGMLLIKSNEMDEKQVDKVRQAFQAMITSNSNSYRMPVFGIDKDEEVDFKPFEQGAKDAEFQYLSDMTARVIFSAFTMSPDELTGWTYLSRGSANQSLSEGNNEYRLTAARDLGLRPLLGGIEDYLNRHIIPLFDPELAGKVVIKLVGLDAETPEKEDIRLQQALKVHMDYDEVRQKVEKSIIGKFWGGRYPLSPDWQAIADKLFTVGEQLEYFCDRPGASKDPALNYRRDPFYFQQQQLMLQQKQLDLQATTMQKGGGPDVNKPPENGTDVTQSSNPEDQGSGGGSAQNLPKNREPNGPEKGFESKMDDLEQNIEEAKDSLE